MANYTPGPWHACRKGKCRCRQIWCDDYPIATVLAGEWGDEYPVLKITGDPSAIGAKVTVEAEMGRVAYGLISEDEAEANGILMAAAPVLLEALEGMVENVEEMQSDDDISACQCLGRAPDDITPPPPCPYCKAHAALAKATCLPARQEGDHT